MRLRFVHEIAANNRILDGNERFKTVRTMNNRHDQTSRDKLPPL